MLDGHVRSCGFARILILSVGLALLAGNDAHGEIPAFAGQGTELPSGVQTAVLAGGCFWGVDGVFKHVRGVSKVVAGYAGGTAETAHYETVSTGTTGHAESVEITFDPRRISYAELLRIFFAVAHDPTELDRQGPDVGPQYRSAIFYANTNQQATAHAYIEQLNRAHAFPAPIVTQVVPLQGFYPAEEYHQDFLTRHPDNPYIVLNDLPKLEELKARFPTVYAP